MACCVRGYHEYKDIEAAATRKVLVCGCWQAVVGKIFVVKISMQVDLMWYSMLMLWCLLERPSLPLNLV